MLDHGFDGVRQRLATGACFVAVLVAEQHHGRPRDNRQVRARLEAQLNTARGANLKRALSPPAPQADLQADACRSRLEAAATAAACPQAPIELNHRAARSPHADLSRLGIGQAAKSRVCASPAADQRPPGSGQRGSAARDRASPPRLPLGCGQPGQVVGGLGRACGYSVTKA